jgi:hypothetical protein
MKVLTTKYPDYVIKVDSYPYEDSKELLSTITDWWEHPSRSVKSAVKEKISNYALGEESRNMLGVSLKERLTEGNFAFVCYGDQPVAYGGLRLENNIAICHRLATHPEGWKFHRGIVPDVFLPFQIKTAHELGCKYYQMTFNEHRRGLYEMWANKSKDKLKIRLTDGHDMLAKFDFLGRQFVYESYQYVCQLDLGRPDIEEFFKY